MSTEFARSMVQVSPKTAIGIYFHELGYSDTSNDNHCAACGEYTRFGQVDEPGQIDDYAELIRYHMINDSFPIPNSRLASPKVTIGHHAGSMWVPSPPQKLVFVFKIADNTGLQYSRTRSPFEVSAAPPGVEVQQVFSDARLLRLDTSDPAKPRLVMESCEIGTNPVPHGDATWACFLFDGEQANEIGEATGSGPAAFTIRMNLIDSKTGKTRMVRLADGTDKAWPCGPHTFHVRPLAAASGG